MNGINGIPTYNEIQQTSLFYRRQKICELFREFAKHNDETLLQTRLDNFINSLSQPQTSHEKKTHTHTKNPKESLSFH
jgi:hypothetical protein